MTRAKQCMCFSFIGLGKIEKHAKSDKQTKNTPNKDTISATRAKTNETTFLRRNGAETPIYMPNDNRHSSARRYCFRWN